MAYVTSVITEEKPTWFCLRSKPKSEHIIAAHLQTNLRLEVFAPRIRFRRSTRRGAVWVTEPLFPSYLFAKFALHEFSRQVHYAPGVNGVVRFGNKWSTVPDEAIEELRQIYGRELIHVIDPTVEVGDAVEITGGALHGLKAVVTRVLPARERIAVLLDFLGQQTMVEVSLDQVVREKTPS